MKREKIYENEDRKEENKMAKRTFDYVSIVLETEKLVVRGKPYRKIREITWRGCPYAEWPEKFTRKFDNRTPESNGIYPNSGGICVIYPSCGSGRSLTKVEKGSLITEDVVDYIKQQLTELNASIDEANRLAEKWNGIETLVL